jgi:hypothetical protein
MNFGFLKFIRKCIKYIQVASWQRSFDSLALAQDFSSGLSPQQTQKRRLAGTPRLTPARRLKFTHWSRQSLVAGH